MQITLNNVLPEPLRGMEMNSELWLRRNLKFESGKTYLVKAFSGMGKTTLLSILFGIRNDYEGEINIDEQNIGEITLNKWADLRKMKLSYVFQGLRLFPELTAFENIQVKNSLSNFKTSDKINEMARELNVHRHLNKTANILSFGQQQRIAIIRALCQPFDFLFLDEPFSHLDKKNISFCLEVIDKELKKQGAGLILSSLGSDYDYNFDYVINL